MEGGKPAFTQVGKTSGQGAIEDEGRGLKKSVVEG